MDETSLTKPVTVRADARSPALDDRSAPRTTAEQVKPAAAGFATALDCVRAALRQAHGDGARTDEQLEVEVRVLVAVWLARLQKAAHSLQTTVDAPATCAPPAPAPPGPAAEPAAEIEPSRDLPERPPPPPSRFQRQMRLARLGLWLRNFGLVVLLFVPFQLWGTGASQARSQEELNSSFRDSLARLAAGAGVDPVKAPPVPDGEAVAVMAIPKLGLRQAVVEGSNVADLRKGPGHYKRTVQPGEPGNAAIAGHRTTYGAPFGRLDELKRGDLIDVTTRRGTFRYQVSEQRVVKPSDNTVLQPTADARLTLTTCHPKYRMSERLIVTAGLMGDAKPASPASGSEQERDLAMPGDKGELVPSLFWAVVLVAMGRGIWVLAGRWAPRPAYLLAGPFLLLALLQLYTHLDRLLPASI